MRALFVFLTYLATAQVLFPQQQEEEQTLPDKADTAKAGVVDYSGDQVEYLPSEGKMILRGQAEVRYKDITVSADTVRFESKAREVFAEGSPVLRSGPDTLYGKRMGYHLDTRRGFVEEGRTRIEKGWFTGRLIKLVGKKTFNIEDGTFTTCEHNPPHYYFVAKKMKVYANDMVVCEPIVLKVRVVPVFAVPFWFFPIKSGRHSGFLIPRVGRSSEEGKYVRRIAYYWVVNDYSDITFSFDYMEKKGPKTDIEGVYLVKPFVSGRIWGSFIDEYDTEKRRWKLYANHQQTLWGGASLSGHADFLSDASYNVDYEEERIVQLNKQMKSYLSIRKSWSGAIAEIVFDRTKDYQKAITTEKVPTASFSLSSRPVFSPGAGQAGSWYHSLYYSYRGVAINSRERKEILESHRGADNLFTFTSPQQVFRYLTFSPTLTLRETVYDRDTLGVRYPIRHHYVASANAGTVIYGLSRKGIGMAKQFRHILRPSLSYSYAPEADQSRYYSFPGIGGVSSANNLSISLGNDFQVKLERSGEVKKLDLAALNLATSYNFKAEDKRLSNISSALDINPTPFMDVRAVSSHNPYTRDLEGLSVTTALRLGGRASGEEGRSPWRLNVNHSYIRGAEGGAAQQLWGGVGFNLTRSWRVDYGMRYDLTEGVVVDRQLRLYRDLHCWEADFNWSSYGERWRYDFKIRIKAVPEIRLGKGVLGLFLP